MSALLILALFVVGVMVCTPAAWISGLVGLGYGVVYFFIATWSGFAPSASTAHLRMEPPAESENGPDPAYRSYFAGPILRDHYRVVTTAAVTSWRRVVAAAADEQPSVVMKVKRFSQRLGSDYLVAALRLPLFVVRIGLTVGVLVGFVLVGVISVVFTALVLVLVLGALITTYVSRALELGVLRVRGITIECPSCHHKVLRPVFRCSRCQARHRRLVPGVRGVFRRTCQCQATLPTLLVLGKANLVSQCEQPDCQAVLPSKAQAMATFHVPVVAGPAAGKSVYMHTAVARLMFNEDNNGFAFASDEARDTFERTVDLGARDDPNQVMKTAVGRPRAYNLHVGLGWKKRMLYLYDAAGEMNASADHLADAHYLLHTKGVVFIVDPFSLRPVRSAAPRTTLRSASASSADAKSVLDNFVQSLQEHTNRGRTKRFDIRVAVVITKSDILRTDSELVHPYQHLSPTSDRASRDQAAKDWLITTGGGRDMVNSLANHFPAVSYFVVSYQDMVEVEPRPVSGSTDLVVNDDPAEPLLWLLDRRASA